MGQHPGYKHTQQARENMRRKQLGKKKSEETKQKIGRSVSATYQQKLQRGA